MSVGGVGVARTAVSGGVWWEEGSKYSLGSEF